MTEIDFIDYNSADYQTWLLTLAPEDRYLLGEMSLAETGQLTDEQLERRRELRQRYLKGKLIEQVTQVKNKTPSTPKVNDEGDKPADTLYALAQSEITEMYRDHELKTPYVVIDVNGTRKPLNMDGDDFKLVLATMYENHIYSLPTSEQSALISENDLKKVIRNLQARNNNNRKLHTRAYYSHAENAVYYDFQNPQYEQARITTQGYQIIGDAHLSFRRLDEYHAQALPDRESTNGRDLLQNLIRSFNILDESDNGNKNLLFLVSLISKFFGRNHLLANPIDAINGPPQAAKTSLLMLVKFLLDPSDMGEVSRIKLMLTIWGNGRPEDARNRKLTVARQYYTIFDNIGHHLSGPEQDELSMYSTGGEVSERKLHSNTDLVTYSTKGYVGYTSINDIVTQADTIGRQLQYELEIKTESLSERLFWERNIKHRPAILHFIFMTISKALSIYPEIAKTTETTSHRLSDFAILGEAISQALGQPAGKFIEIMTNLNKEQNIRSVENNQVVSTLVNYTLNNLMIERGKNFEILASELLEGFKHHYQVNGGNINDPYFPQNAQKFGNRIKMFTGALKSHNIEIRKLGHTNKGTAYNITIRDNDNEDLLFGRAGQ